MGNNVRYALRRKLNGYNKCILWRLDENNKFVECLTGYINYTHNTVKVYKNHQKVDTISLLLLVPLRRVEGLSESQTRALAAEGILKAEA